MREKTLGKTVGWATIQAFTVLAVNSLFNKKYQVTFIIKKNKAFNSY